MTDFCQCTPAERAALDALLRGPRPNEKNAKAAWEEFARARTALLISRLPPDMVERAKLAAANRKRAIDEYNAAWDAIAIAGLVGDESPEFEAFYKMIEGL